MVAATGLQTSILVACLSVGRSGRVSWTPVSTACSVLPPQINRMDYVEINIDHKFHRHLIGKSGANSE